MPEHGEGAGCERGLGRRALDESSAYSSPRPLSHPAPRTYATAASFTRLLASHFFISSQASQLSHVQSTSTSVSPKYSRMKRVRQVAVWQKLTIALSFCWSRARR